MKYILQYFLESQGTTCITDSLVIINFSIRVWDKIAESMQLIARNTTGIKARISQWAKGVGLKGNLSKQLG